MIRRPLRERVKEKVFLVQETFHKRAMDFCEYCENVYTNLQAILWYIAKISKRYNRLSNILFGREYLVYLSNYEKR